MNANPNRLSLNYLRALGYTVDIVERWVTAGAGGAQVRKDLFGILDLIAVREGDEVTLGVQSTSKANMASRARKMAQAPETRLLLSAGWVLVVHGWWQPGGPRHRYELEEIVVEAEEVRGVVVDEESLVGEHEAGEHTTLQGACPVCSEMEES